MDGVFACSAERIIGTGVIGQLRLHFFLLTMNISSKCRSHETVFLVGSQFLRSTNLTQCLLVLSPLRKNKKRHVDSYEHSHSQFCPQDAHLLTITTSNLNYKIKLPSDINLACNEH